MRRLLAAVVAWGLLAAACSSGLETPAETLQRENEVQSLFGYVVSAPPEGYALCAISTPSAMSLRADATASLHVYGDGALDDPYEGPLFGVAMFESAPLAELPLGDTVEVEVLGRPARLGTADALRIASLPPDAGRTLSYQLDGGQTVQLVVRNDTATDLITLAQAVVVSDGVATIDTDALPPGFVGLGDLYQLEGQPQFRFSLDYQAGAAADGSIDDQLTLLGTTGDAASMEAFRFRAGESGRIEVGGRPGVSADIGSSGEGPFVVSWLAEDGLILRVFSFVIPREELAVVAANVTRVAGEEWTDLRAEFELSGCER